MALNRLIEPKNSLAVWLTRALISTICYLMVEVRSDVKKLVETVPVLQEKIEVLQKNNERLTNKVFAMQSAPAKHEDEITFQNILKYRQ